MHHISSAELLDLTVATAMIHTHEHKVAACRGPEMSATPGLDTAQKTIAERPHYLQ